jgi:pimeloyl-ACP methyl ester carboxylesterase
MGHSRGANQTAWFAAERLEVNDVKAIALLAPMTWSDTRPQEFYRQHHGLDITPVLERAHALQSDQMLEDVPFLFYPDASANAGSYLSYHGNETRLNTPYLMPKISQPLLVLAAEADEIFDDLPDQVKKLECSNLQFIIVPGADHFFKGQFGVEAANAMADFIERVE